MFIWRPRYGLTYVEYCTNVLLFNHKPTNNLRQTYYESAPYCGEILTLRHLDCIEISRVGFAIGTIVVTIGTPV
jgi:hypothetical protein